jgi:hypothetical protein
MRYVFTKISAHLPSNQTHERKRNVFEGDIVEVARVNNNNVRRNTISENLRNVAFWDNGPLNK